MYSYFVLRKISCYLRSKYHFYKAKPNHPKVLHHNPLIILSLQEKKQHPTLINLFQETEKRDIKEAKSMASCSSFLDQEGTSSDTTPSGTSAPSNAAAPVVNAAPSIAGILFKHFPSDNYYFNCFHPGHHPPTNPSFPSSIPQPFFICSSSKGLLLVYKSSSNSYHVFNPFVHNADSYRRIPSPPRSHKDYDTAVLSVNNQLPAFDIICAVEEADGGKYTFDWYHSGVDKWVQGTRLLDISPRRILMHTGISDDSGAAFWLTDDQKMVVTFNTVDSSGLQKLDLPKMLHSAQRKYLGKISDDKIGVVIAKNSILALYSLGDQGCSWRSYKFLDLAEAGIIAPYQLERADIMRFNKDVPFCVGNRSFLLKMSSNPEDATVHELHHWVRIPLLAGELVPYEVSTITPAQFPVRENEENIVDDEQSVDELYEAKGKRKQSADSQEDGRDLKRIRKD
ncbi:uncharacterized protein A4U43_C03F27200 [Asparagus officinalis]|uniref:Uncharacterized protein n=1 Tax=Asparagus officinalis TaxID=4686 RepID=A0A5P1FE56_ASPOF|nr:uncharacterized protein LOC109834475 [Asparagus officinalis]ONK76392.1 uncharacterized protein A4U43_C03F27200 [Asparagus officinalis]